MFRKFGIVTWATLTNGPSADPELVRIARPLMLSTDVESTKTPSVSNVTGLSPAIASTANPLRLTTVLVGAPLNRRLQPCSFAAINRAPACVSRRLVGSAMDDAAAAGGVCRVTSDTDALAGLAGGCDCVEGDAAL